MKSREKLGFSEIRTLEWIYPRKDQFHDKMGKSANQWIHPLSTELSHSGAMWHKNCPCDNFYIFYPRFSRENDQNDQKHTRN